jgi:hypothetical protein
MAWTCSLTRTTPVLVQGHALFTRQAGSTIPCPVIDLVGGFNGYFASAYNLPAGTTIKDKFGKDFGGCWRQIWMGLLWTVAVLLPAC